MIKINLSTKKRMRMMLFIIFLIIIILIGRLGYIQIIDGKKLSEMAYEQQTLDRTINPKRGTIYDATGQVLAQSSTVETVTVNPGNIKKEEKEKVAKKLSEIFELDYDKVLKKVSKRSSIETIAKKVDKEKSDELRKWIEEPLINKEEINHRLDSVDELFNNIYFTEELREALKNIYDIERIVGKISNKNVNAKDLVSLNMSLLKLPEIKEKLSQCNSSLLSQWHDNLDVLSDISDLLSNALLDDPSTSIKEGKQSFMVSNG